MNTTHQDAFFSLSQLEDEQIEVPVGALLIAKDAYPELDITVYLEKLDQMGEEAKAQIGGTTDLSAQIADLNHYLFEKQGFSGNDEDYYDPRNSYLNDVLDRKLGLPITLSIVYIEVGNRIGLRLVGIGFPGHFLVKQKGEYSETFIDPFEQGKILTKRDLNEKLQMMPMTQGEQMRPEFLQELTNKQTLVRVLRNLLAIYLKDKAYERAARVGEQITWLAPKSALDYRDLGYLYYQIDSYGRSLRAFEKYLELEDGEPDREKIEFNVQTLKKQIAMMN